ncbi:MAG: asparagine synthase (glutamine-hydrolyzing) [Burkholderiales bacterium]
MGGITGFFSASGTLEVGEPDLHRAVESLRHRGPNDQEAWLGAPDIGMGYTKLSILNPNQRGRQPILSADGCWSVVVNGEIYNIADIRSELASKGHAFRGIGTDEVIVAAVREWGVNGAVKRFNGAFAIALWDARAGKLTLIRDRMGVKPLYYGWNGRTVWFGSELKALRAYHHWQPRIDDAALADFFRFTYIVEPRSIYQQVCKLGPGHVLEIARGGSPSVWRYWGVLDDFQCTESQAGEEALADELESLISDACRIRTASDAPAGIFLSGGVDSSVVAAMVARDHSGMRTFTIGFDDPRYNEAHHAEDVARHLGMLHSTQVVREAEAMEVLPTWGDLFDEPFGDCSGIPTLLASRMAARHVKVVLLADGADELFGTYQSYEASFHRMQSPRNRSTVGRVARIVASALPWERIDHAMAVRGASADPGRSFGRKLTQHLRYLREIRALTTPGRMFEHSQTSSNWHGADLPRLLGHQTPPTRRTSDAYPGDPEEQMRLWDLENYTSACILTKVDRATMAAGIQCREPLLDHRVVAMALSLPDRLRGGPLGAKHLLRRVLYRHVPRELIERPKMGFSPPIGRWMSGALKPMLDQYLDHRRISEQAILDPHVVRQVRQRFDAGDEGSAHRVWLLLAFQMWHARWMEMPPLAGAPTLFPGKTSLVEAVA